MEMGKLQTKTNNTMNERELLLSIAQTVDCMGHLISDMADWYFMRFSSENEKDHCGILYEFNRNRARMDMLSRLMKELSEEFEKNNIIPYS